MNILNQHIDFTKVYPFYFVLELEGMTIIEGGELFQKLYPGGIGRPMKETMKIIRPSSDKLDLEYFESVKDKQLHLISTFDELSYRGPVTITPEKDKAIFLVFPWFFSTDQFGKSGIKMNELHAADSTPDVIQMIQMNTINYNELRDQQIIMDFIFSNVDIFIAAFDYKGKKLYSNKKYRQFYKALDKEQRALLQDSIEREGDGDQYEERVFAGDNHYELLVTHKDDKIIVVGKNVTKEVNLENARREKLVAENQSKFVSNFLANMSHEIRTPLNGVLGMLDLMDGDNLTAGQKKNLNFIKISGLSLLNIINDVLDISKIQSGNYSLKPKRENILALIRESKRLYSASAKSNHNKIFIDLVSGIPMFLEIDKLRYKQVLNNLVSNANKFTDGGEITITASYDNGYLTTEIKDTGVGIKKEDLDKLFIEFSQIDSSYTKENDGTGLGLALCKKLSKLMGGDVKVKSEYQKGSTFTFTIKASESANQNAEPKAEIKKKNVSLKGKRILIVEDKEVNQRITRLLLAKLECSSEVVENGLEAVNRFKEGEYDAILMDIQMPVMDGLEATQKIKEKFKNVPPMIALSANAMEGDKEEYLSKGLDGYISKPVNLDKLRDGLLEYLD